MNKLVKHQEFLEAWLLGEIIEIKIDHGNEGESGWCDFNLDSFNLNQFNSESCYFRKKVNLVAIDINTVFRQIKSLAYSHTDGVLYLEDVNVCLTRNIDENYKVVEV